MNYEHEAIRAAEKLAAIIKEVKERYQIECESSRAEYMKTIPAGSTAPAPATNIIIGAEHDEAFNSYCAEARAKASDVIDQLINTLAGDITEPPTEEAARLIQALQTRKDISAAELNAIHNKYIGNYQTAAAIVAIALDNGIHLDNNAADLFATLEEIKKEINKTLSLSAARRGNMTSGYMAMFESSIKSKLGIEKNIFS